MSDDTRTTNAGSLDYRLGVLQGRVENHERQLQEINAHLERQDHEAERRHGETEGRIDMKFDAIKAVVDATRSEEEAARKAQERRLANAELALASYVAGESHRRDRMRTIERAIYGTATVLLTALMLSMFNGFLTRPHSVLTLGGDSVSVVEIGLLFVCLVFMAWRTLSLSSPSATTRQHPPTP